jgi:subtilisin family serine protease
MRNTFILILLFVSISAYSQNKKLVIRIDNPDYIPKVEKKGICNELTLNTGITGLAETFSKYKIYKFEQLFPSAKRSTLLKYYILEVERHNELKEEIEEKHLDKFPYIKEYFEPIPLYVPNDYNFTLRTGNDGLRDVGLTYLDLINAPAVWEITKGDPDIIIGIYDTHLHVDHEDLNGKIFNVYDANVRTSFFPITYRDHGTSVAGVAAANTNNNIGISSIAFNCRLAKASNLKNYLLDMAEDGIKVINISMDWGPEREYDIELMETLVEDYNITVVAAAGNENSENYIYPASYDNVISVTSVGHEFERGTTFWGRKFNWKDVHKKYIDPDLPDKTHTHNDKVDICAPGYNIVTFCHPETYKTGGGTPTGQLYHSDEGTSFAAPMVAGVCALMYSINPGITPLEVKNIIKSTAVDIYSIPENYEFIGKLGAGRIDAFEAVKEAGTTYLTGLQNSKSISAGFGFKLYNVTINTNANLALTARKEVEITGTFEMPLGSTFEVEINPNAVTMGN